MMAHFLWYFDPLSLIIQKKNVVRSGPPLAKISGSAHGPYLSFQGYVGAKYVKCERIRLETSKQYFCFQCSQLYYLIN